MILEVVDNGVGIEPNDIGQVFVRGFSLRRHSGGSGLGLHIVRELVAAVDGSVRVWSRPRVSTTFRLYLPVFERG